MKALYPSIKKIAPLFILLFIAGAVSAQSGDYASAGKQTSSLSYSTSTPGVVEAVIRVKARTDKKILLTWTPFKGEVSHYVLERSTDGRQFFEAALLFTGEQEVEPDYYYTDKFRNAYLGILYYRLKVVGLDGSVIFTPVTIISSDRM